MKETVSLDIANAIELPEALTNNTLTVTPGAVFLKIFVPPHYDGAYLAFGADGEAVGVIDGDAVSILEQARGVPASDLLLGSDGQLDPDRLDLITTLLEEKLLQVRGPDEDCSAVAYWICPDTAKHTRHTGEGADRFIQNFYRYFGGVFHDGSVLIDSHGEFLEAIARFFPTSPGKDCLDAGCGSGHYTSALARLGHRVYGVDISDTRLRACRMKPSAPGEIITVEANVEDIPLPDEALDFTMSNFVLEHVADPFAVIDELVRLLRPGGEMLLAVPSFNIRDMIVAWLYEEPPSLNFEHLRSYGLIPNTHPWCAETHRTIEYIKNSGCEVLTVEGTSILDGLWEPWLGQFQAIAARYGTDFATRYPWNHLGRQTIIYARKTGAIQ